MRCALCGKEEQHDPSVATQWRCVSVSRNYVYACQQEFPPDDADENAFEAAYTRFFAAGIAEELRRLSAMGKGANNAVG